jgi:hypothetical protein
MLACPNFTSSPQDAYAAPWGPFALIGGGAASQKATFCAPQKGAVGADFLLLAADCRVEKRLWTGPGKRISACDAASL